MFLVEFELNTPNIQKISVRRNKMIIIRLGFCTIFWMNNQLAELHKQVVRLGMDNIEVVADYDNKVHSIELNYVYRLEELVAVNKVYVNQINALEKKIKKHKQKQR
jgi:hypothetical protein